MAKFWKKIVVALAEVGFIVFLFYTNLLMGQFTRSQSSPSVLAALSKIFTPTNAVIGLIGATIGYFCIEAIRKRL
jgi:hypothetical protein